MPLPTNEYYNELVDAEDDRDIWQEVLDGIKEIKAGGGSRYEVKRLTSDDHLWDGRELGADPRFIEVIDDDTTSLVEANVPRRTKEAF